MSVLYCPDQVDLRGRRVLFLAGPNRHSPLWRARGIDYLLPKIPPDVVICSPERLDDRKCGPYSAQQKIEQMNWERDHLLAALPKVDMQAGVWLFWLPHPEQVVPTGRNYGQRTCHELGISAALIPQGLQVAIGAETGYPGLQSTMHTYEWFGESAPKLHSSLKEVCDEALRLLS
ncbi:MAG: hypothetical protein AAGA35_04225 [Patescibacteria group bacterium]